MGDYLIIILLILLIFTVLISKAFSTIINKIPKRIREKTIYKILSSMLIILLASLPLIMRIQEDCYKKEPFDKEKATSILRETWRPLKEFNENVIIVEKNDEALPPPDIKTKEDFMNYFQKTFPEFIAKDFYKVLIKEKDNGVITVNRNIHFPSIYDGEQRFVNAYKKVKKKEEELVITESGITKEGGPTYTRENFYRKDKNDKWILHSFSGNIWIEENKK